VVADASSHSDSDRALLVVHPDLAPAVRWTPAPAVWISNGTRRDGAARRNAPKVGWCWAGNRHTWLGFASAAAQVAARW
jgi:hypothetical protein